MAASVMLPSFAAGELSPSLYARVDLDKYHSGASKMRNFFVDYRGGASTRTGTEFIDDVGGDGGNIFDLDWEVRIIPFIVSREQSYVLVFVSGQVKIYSNGNLISTLTSGYDPLDIWGVKYTQSADVMTLVHPNYAPQNLSRHSATVFTFDPIVAGSEIDAPAANPTCVSTVPSAVQSYCYCITALDKNGAESLASQPTECGSKILDPTAATPVTIAITWPAVAGATKYNVYKAGPVAAGDAMPTVYGYIGQSRITSFTDNNIGPDFTQVPPDHRDPFSPGQVTSIDITSPGTGMVGDYEPVIITGAGSGAQAFVVAQGVTGIAAGVVILNDGINYTTATTAAPTSGSATFKVNVDLNNRYPSCVSYFQQRRCFAGSDYAPTLIEMSKTGQYNNFDTSPAVLDSDAITINIASREVNRVQHMVPMSLGLVCFTTGTAFLISGGGIGSGAPVSPTTVSATPQASTGAGHLQPIVINYNILFQQYEGTVIRDMTYQWQTNSYYGLDRSMLSNHLFFGYHLQDWAFAFEPFHLLHIVRDDGQMVVMAYVPEQEVFGWSTYDTQGSFRSVCVVPEDNEDRVYAIVRRWVADDIGNPPHWRNMLERFHSRKFDCEREARFLDSTTELPVMPGLSQADVSVSGNTVTLKIKQPTTSAFIGFGPPTIYTMSAEENYSAAQATALLTSDFPELNFGDTYSLGHAFNPVLRKLFYPMTIQQPRPTRNTTPYTIWDGETVVLAGALMNQHSLVMNVAEKDIDTGVVNIYNVYDPTKVVPAGIGPGNILAVTITTPGSGMPNGGPYSVNFAPTGGSPVVAFGITITGGVATAATIDSLFIPGFNVGDTLTSTDPTFPGIVLTVTSVNRSDGTWRRYSDNVYSAENFFYLSDPRTGDFWMRASSCELYVFRRADNYAMTISPYRAVYSNDADVMPLGLTNDWMYAAEPSTDYSHYYLTLIPRLTTAPEVAADRLLGYASFIFPFDSNQLFWTTTMRDGTLYAATVVSFGAVLGDANHKLYKFTPPTSAPYGGPVVGGGWTDVTPWTSTTGPNLVAQTYKVDSNKGDYAARFVIFDCTDRLGTFPMVGVVTSVRKEEKLSTDFNDTLFQITMYSTSAPAPHFQTFTIAQGYMDYTWRNVTDPAKAKYALTGKMVQVNPYLDRHDYVFDTMAERHGDLWQTARRWIYFEVYPVNNGVVDTNTTKIVMVLYNFSGYYSTTVLTVIDEQGWDDAYPEYESFCHGPVIDMSIDTSLQWPDGVYQQAGYDAGIFDFTSQSFWWSGEFMGVTYGLGSKFIHRFEYFNVSAPLLKINLYPPADGSTCLDLGCVDGLITAVTPYSLDDGTMTITATITKGSLTPIPGTNVYSSLLPGQWGVGFYQSYLDLTHLVGSTVGVVEDGVYKGTQVVPTNGVVTLSAPTCNAYAGLLFSAQFQTLKLETGEPTIQGRRKIIPAVTLRVKDSVGFKVGTHDFNNTMYQPKTQFDGYTAWTLGADPTFFTGDIRVNVGDGWEEAGTITVQQDLPYPVTILGIIPEVTIGDTQR